MTKARKKLTKEKGRGVTASRAMGEFREGERVVLRIEPSVQKGRPHPRYQGRVGVVRGRRGKAYEVEITDGGKIKKVIILPEHLVRVGD
ncbi:MAG: 50S ribosomal protein L21e [Hadesarchaea archaeon]|jgi:large subunit ribosomal protein L21e|nr:50S ribosomal protein L21e [Hadesarchaea archaeon]